MVGSGLGTREEARDRSGGQERGWEWGMGASTKVGSICETENSPKAGTVSPHTDRLFRRGETCSSINLGVSISCVQLLHQPRGLQPCRSHQTKYSVRGPVSAHMGDPLTATPVSAHMGDLRDKDQSLSLEQGATGWYGLSSTATGAL